MGKKIYCKKCKKKTEHIKVGYRKPFEKQKYRCEECSNEVYK
jgi:transposase-like protein